MSRPKKVNTRLKQLAESRARATATIERLHESLDNLRPKIEKAKAELRQLEELKFNAEYRLTQHHNEIRATDKTILEEFPGVEPTEIPSTYGFRSEYGKRGSLLETIRNVLKDAGEEGVTLKELGLQVTKKLGLVHNSHADFRAWVNNSLESALWNLRHNKKELTNVKVPGKHPRWKLARNETKWEDLILLDPSNDKS